MDVSTHKSLFHR